MLVSICCFLPQQQKQTRLTQVVSFSCIISTQEAVSQNKYNATYIHKQVLRSPTFQILVIKELLFSVRRHAICTSFLSYKKCRGNFSITSLSLQIPCSHYLKLTTFIRFNQQTPQLEQKTTHQDVSVRPNRSHSAQTLQQLQNIKHQLTHQ